MWRPLLHPFFLICLAAYLYVRLGRWEIFEVPIFVNNYLADFACMPIILTFCLVGVRKVKRMPHFELTIVMILGMTTFYALLFEWILPTQSFIYTSDFGDVLAYFLGAGCFYLLRLKMQ